MRCHGCATFSSTDFVALLAPITACVHSVNCRLVLWRWAACAMGGSTAATPGAKKLVGPQTPHTSAKWAVEVSGAVNLTIDSAGPRCSSSCVPGSRPAGCCVPTPAAAGNLWQPWTAMEHFASHCPQHRQGLSGATACTPVLPKGPSATPASTPSHRSAPPALATVGSWAAACPHQRCQHTCWQQQPVCWPCVGAQQALSPGLI